MIGSVNGLQGCALGGVFVCVVLGGVGVIVKLKFVRIIVVLSMYFFKYIIYYI